SEPLSDRSVKLAVFLAFASGVVVGWQANRARRYYLKWRKRRLQDQLAATQNKLELA
uniref:Mitoregulin n=1 Tax=Laticauda laticaudata TaxID=8630 RepID=A0A8C5SPG0_LATLA